MKNFIKIILILLSFLLASSIYGQYNNPTHEDYIGEPEAHSLRAMAMGGYTLDDLDRSFDPIELRFVEGFRLFTNLGNYNGGGDRILSGGGDSEYLIGFAMQNPMMDKLSNALLIKYTNVDNSNAVINSDFFGTNADDVGVGELLSEFTTWTIDGSGNFANKHTTSMNKSSFDYTDTKAIVLNNSFALGNAIIGGKISYTDKKDEGTIASVDPALISSGTVTLARGFNTGDATFGYNYKNYNIAEGYYEEKQSESGDFSNIDETTNFDFIGSYLMPDYMGYELRGDLGYYYKSRAINVIDKYSGNLADFLYEVEFYVDDFDEDGTFNAQEEVSGSTFGLHTSIRKTFNKASTRGEDDFWEVGALFDFGIYDYFNNQSSELENTTQDATVEANFFGDDSVTTWHVSDYKNSLDIADDGDLTSMNYGFISKYEQTLHEKVRFVAGTQIVFSSKTWETVQSLSAEEYNQTVNGEIFLDPNGNYFDETNDTREISTSGYTADRTREEFVTKFEAVSGIEFKFTENNKWLMRIGSVYTVIKTVNDDNIQITDADPTVTETWDGSGSYSMVNSESNYKSTSSHSVTTVSSTLFRYGLGYKPNENLSIDILGVFDGSGITPATGAENEDIFDVIYLQSLKLSFSLRW